VTGDELNDLYHSCTRYAWRLEARDVYGVPEENDRLQAWLAGRPLPRSDSKDAWKELTSGAAAAGRPFARVRMIGRPLTDYTRWEYEVYSDNISAGEQVRVLERDWLTDADRNNPLWLEDFWLFDDEIAVVQNYGDDGSYLGPTRAADPAPYVALRRRALELSVPYSDFTLLPDQRRGEQQTRSEAARVD
jgi:hypothetical protein